MKQSKFRVPQYLAVWALVFFSGHSAVKGAVLAVKELLGTSWSQVVAGAKAVAILEACRGAKAVVEWGQSMLRSLGQVETTSQVCATRANADEWRQCLQFGSQWHQCPLQAAYLLWQKGRMAVPACPANQWNVLAEGQPLSVMDQCLAESAVPEVEHQVLDVDYRLSGVHEKWLLKEAGAEKYSVEESRLIDEVEAVYQQFKKECLQLTSVDGKKDSAKLAQLVQWVRGQVDFKSAVFKWGSRPRTASLL